MFNIGSAFLHTVAFLLWIICLPSAFCGDEKVERFEFSEIAMGVRARIVVYASSEEEARTACKAAFDRIAELENIMSDYRPTSELMRLCASAGAAPVKVSPELLNILERSAEMSRRSDGAFDVTIGPMVRLWRKARQSKVLPSCEEIEAARKLVGWHNIEINPETRMVRLAVPGMQLDLGGIAKGYACDEALRVIRNLGISRALVEMGGDIAVGDPPPGKTGWRIEVANVAKAEHERTFTTNSGVRWEFKSTGQGQKSLVIDGCSNVGISSSGDTEQFIEIDGKRYSHIVDPRSGLGLTNRIAVTIVARDCTTSDSLATTVSVLGEKKGLQFIESFDGVSAYIRRLR